MRCLNCRLDGILQSTQICPRCNVYLPTVLRDVLPLGTLLRGGDYRIDYALGRGGFGITYRATHTSLEKLVAIKEFYPQDQAHREGTSGRLNVPTSEEDSYQRGLQRFEREGRILAKLNHPNVVSVVDFFKERGTAYLVMELLPGYTLKDELESQPGKRLPVERVKIVMIALVDALTLVHQQGIYHLDLKPDNVMVIPGGRIVLVDFGASRQNLVTRTATHRSTHSFTEAYAAPEVIAGGKVGAQSDLFELGMMLHEMLTGKLPPSALNRLMNDNWIPQGLDEPWQGMVTAALQIKPENRPQTVQGWWDVLRFEEEQRQQEAERQRLEADERASREAEEQRRREEERKRQDPEAAQQSQREQEELRRREAEERARAKAQQQHQKTQVVPTSKQALGLKKPMQLSILSVLVVVGGLVGYFGSPSLLSRKNASVSTPQATASSPSQSTETRPLNQLVVQTNSASNSEIVRSKTSTLVKKEAIVLAGSVLQRIFNPKEAIAKTTNTWVYLRVCSIGEKTTPDRTPNAPQLSPGDEVRIPFDAFSRFLPQGKYSELIGDAAAQCSNRNASVKPTAPSAEPPSESSIP